MFNYTATTEIYTYGHTLSLHDALPIYVVEVVDRQPGPHPQRGARAPGRRVEQPQQPGRPEQRPDRPQCGDVDPLHRSSFVARSEEHTSELQSLMRISYAVICLKKKNIHTPST